MPKGVIIFLVIFGGIFGTMGGFLTYNSFSIILNGEQVEGEIIDYNSHYSDGTLMYTPIVSYKCFGTKFEKGSGVSSSWKSYETGEITNIYCNGEEFIFKNGFDKYFGLPFLVIGLIVMSIPIIVKVFNIRKQNRKKELIRNGDYIRVPISFVGYNTSLSVNGRNPMYFLCEYLDRDTNKIYQFKSYNFWHSRLNEFIKVGDERKVYVSRMNMKKYYVDIEDIPTV